MAAVSAVRSGLAVEIVDESPRLQTRGHATVVHASSLRLLEELGLSSKVIESSCRLDRIGVYVDGVRSTTLELESPAFAVSQGALEDVLRSALASEGVEVSAARRAATIMDDGSGVRVRMLRWELDSSAGDESEATWRPVSSSVVDADFVIGADGRDSRVRTALGIEVAAVRSPASFAMFELAAGDSLGAELTLALSDGLVSAMIPLPDGRVRFGFELELESEPADALGPKDLSELLAARMTWVPFAAEAVDWGKTVGFRRGLAHSFGKRRVWLAGDAAHGTCPLGTQSMNVGLTEADGLACRIAACVEAGSGPEVLEQYGTESRREWQKLLGFDVSYDLLPHAPDWVRRYARKLVPALPASGSDLDSLLARVGIVVR